MSELLTGEIRAVSLTKKGGLNVNFIQTPEEGGLPSNKVQSVKNDREPHKDLKTAFRKLLAHAMLIGEFVPKGKVIDAQYFKTGRIIDDPEFIKYSVIGFKIKGDEEPSITIKVQKKLNEGGVIEFELPAVKMYGNSKYEYSGNLESDSEYALIEVAEYINDAKYQESNQTSLVFDDSEEEI